MSAPKIPPIGDDARAAFRSRKLDPNNHAHCLLLIEQLCEAMRALGGCPPKWTDQRLSKLICDIDRLQRKHPNMAETGLCRLLSKEKDYRGLSAENLRRRLQDARDPECNGFLTQLVEDIRVHHKIEGRTSREIYRAWLTGAMNVWKDKDGKLSFTIEWPDPQTKPIPKK